MFDSVDLTRFWDDSEYALEEYVSPPPDDALIREVEEELGYKLPASYIALMKAHNGGIPTRCCCPVVGRDKANTLCGEMGTAFWVEEWEYPAIGVVICDTPSAGHDMVFLDYTACGREGEPCVTVVD